MSNKAMLLRQKPFQGVKYCVSCMVIFLQLHVTESYKYFSKYNFNGFIWLHFMTQYSCDFAEVALKERVEIFNYQLDRSISQLLRNTFSKNISKMFLINFRVGVSCQQFLSVRIKYSNFHCIIPHMKIYTQKIVM